METKAKKNSWKTLPMPDTPAELKFNRSFTKEEYVHLSKGLTPHEMEDKWFIFMEKDCLYFHRSWTGFCIYQLKIIPDGEKYTVNEVFVNSKQNQYKRISKNYDIAILDFLIDNLLLGKLNPFPLPDNLPENIPK